MATYQSVTKDDRIVVKPHIERARQSLRAAEVLAREGLFADAVTRAHQATVHGERALLATEVRSPQDPRSVHRLATNHFLQPGLVDGSHLDALERLANLRRRADDQPLASITDDACAEAISKAAAFVAECERYLAELL